MAVAKIWALGSGKLNFHHDIGRVGCNSEFVPVVDTLKYIFAQELASEVNLVSSYACPKGWVHDENIPIVTGLDFHKFAPDTNSIA